MSNNSDGNSNYPVINRIIIASAKESYTYLQEEINEIISDSAYECVGVTDITKPSIGEEAVYRAILCFTNKYRDRDIDDEQDKLIDSDSTEDEN